MICQSNCKCAVCAGLDAEAWAAEKMESVGWYQHLVVGEEIKPAGFNAHTHGLSKTYNHPDFEIVFPFNQGMSDRDAESLINNVFWAFVNRIKEGEKFEVAQEVSDIIKVFNVLLVASNDGKRDLLRVVFPDPTGNYFGGNFDLQIKNLGIEE